MVRDAFVAVFGEDNAFAIENAAKEHQNGIHDRPGSDPFKWALCICIGYECFTKDSYRDYHGITAPVPALKQWIKEHGELNTHDGDTDYLALFAGAYQEYMPDTA